MASRVILFNSGLPKLSREPFSRGVTVADQGRWFKLWCSALTDSSLDNLDIADFGRWCKLGAHVKEHGNDGTIVLSAPERSLCSMLQLDGFEALISLARRLPNVSVTGVTIAIVTFCNWPKYQGDSSADRTRRWRERVTPKKRREEKRGEEIRRDPPQPPAELRPRAVGAGENGRFADFWSAYPKKRSKGDAEKAWRALRPTPEVVEAILAAIEVAKGMDDWTKSGGQFIPYPATWLRAKGWEDSPATEIEAPAAYQRYVPFAERGDDEN